MRKPGGELRLWNTRPQSSHDLRLHPWPTPIYGGSKYHHYRCGGNENLGRKQSITPTWVSFDSPLCKRCIICDGVRRLLRRGKPDMNPRRGRQNARPGGQVFTDAVVRRVPEAQFNKLTEDSRRNAVEGEPKGTGKLDKQQPAEGVHKQHDLAIMGEKVATDEWNTLHNEVQQNPTFWRTRFRASTRRNCSCHLSSGCTLGPTTTHEYRAEEPTTTVPQASQTDDVSSAYVDKPHRNAIRAAPNERVDGNELDDQSMERERTEIS